MNLNDIKIKLEQQFVDDYDTLKEFMDNINETLSDLNINSKYNNYNDFCLDIEKYILNINLIEIQDISPKIMSSALNNMIKSKIMEDSDYEQKNLKNIDNIDEKKNIK